MSPAPREHLLDTLRTPRPESAASARRSRAVTVAKKALPVAAVVLLLALVLIPYLRTGPDANRVTYHIPNTQTASTASHMQGAQYHGTDAQGQPYTLTADTADEQSSGLIALTNPEGDITLKDGAWLMLKSTTGLFHQPSEQLDLSGNVTLYRNDGTTLSVPTATIDLRAGGASSTAPVQVSGPFGTLTAASGFVLLNRGADITFNGPVAMTLTQAQ